GPVSTSRLISALNDATPTKAALQPPRAAASSDVGLGARHIGFDRRFPRKCHSGCKSNLRLIKWVIITSEPEVTKANFEASQVEIVGRQVAAEAMIYPARMRTLGVAQKIWTTGEAVVAHRSAKAVEVDASSNRREVR